MNVPGLGQDDNDARKAVAHLPEIEVEGLENPVVRVLRNNGDLVYALRIQGTRFRPKVFDAEAAYRVEVGDDTVGFQSRKGIRPSDGGSLSFRFK